MKQSGANSVITSSDAVGRLLGLSSLSPTLGSVMEDLLTYGEGLEVAERDLLVTEVGKQPQSLPDQVIAVVRDEKVYRYFDPVVTQLARGDRLVVVRPAKELPWAPAARHPRRGVRGRGLIAGRSAAAGAPSGWWTSGRASLAWGDPDGQDPPWRRTPDSCTRPPSRSGTSCPTAGSTRVGGGASRMREVDDAWPAVGSKLHHSVGVWPLLIDDNTEVTDVDARAARCHAAGPGLADRRGARSTSGCVPVGAETEVDHRGGRGVRPGALVPPPVRGLSLKWRNTETLRRLAFIAERRR